MKGIIIFIGFLIFCILVLLWVCIVTCAKADQKIDKQLRRFDELQKKYNALSLWYSAQKEALDTANEQDSNAKH